ncbi:MAG: peptide-binding protein [Rhodobacterales bacterium]|nr:MAG: peptide-binding protein [Rhodobacterales bacterium]
MIRIILTALLLAGPAFAQDYPALHSVTGVASDDRLNIRAAPDASSDILDSLSPYAISVEVLRTTSDGRWGQVLTGEGNGWVSMRYMARTDEDPWAEPVPLICHGTEPFWRLGLYPKGSEYDSPDTGRRDLSLTSHRKARNGWKLEFQEGPTLTRTLIVQRFPCSDGMSDAMFGYRATLFNDSPDGAAIQSGCCTRDNR